MADRPYYFPLMDLSESNQVDWSVSARVLTGYQPNQVIPSYEHNSLWFLGGLWLTYLDYGAARLAEITNTSTATRLVPSRLAYTVGQNVKTLGAAPSSYTVYWLSGYRVQVDDILLVPAGASPLLVPFATAPGRIWLYLSAAISDPTQPLASIRVESVAPATAATPGVGELAIVGVDIDASGDVTGNVYPGVEPEYAVNFDGPVFSFATTVEHTADLTVTTPGILRADQAEIVQLTVGTAAGAPNLTVLAGGAGQESMVVTSNGVNDAISVAGAGAICVDALTDSATNPGIRVRQVGTAPALRAQSTGVSGTAVEATGAGPGAGVEATGGASGNGVTATGGATLGDGVSALATSATGAGVRAVSSNNATSVGVMASTVHVDSYAVQASTAVGNAGSAAVYALGFGDAIAVRASSTNGYGLVVQSDTTSPTRAAVRMVPADADPSTSAQGDIGFNTARSSLGKLRLRDLGGWTSIHNTQRGYVFAFGTTDSGGPLVFGGAAVSPNLSLVQISPEEVGDVLLTGTASITFQGDASACTLSIYDLNTASLVATQSERGADIDLAGNPVRSCVIRAVATLPDTASRTWALVIEATAGTITAYARVIMSVQGVQ